MRTRVLGALVMAASMLGGVVGAPATAHAQIGSAFTYQGKLHFDGVPANGTYDMRFSAFNATGGLFPPVICVDGVQVVDGLFTVVLDFGPTNFGLQRVRQLQIEVRSDFTPNNCGTGAYTLLEPRQELTPAPYALQTRGLLTDAEERIGLGGSPGAHRLRIYGGLEVLDNDDPGEGVRFETPSFALLDETANDLYRWESADGAHVIYTRGGTPSVIVNRWGNVAIGDVPDSESIFHIKRDLSRLAQVFETTRSGDDLPLTPVVTTRSPGAATSVASSPGGAWSNIPGGLLSDDGSRATAPLQTLGGSSGQFGTRKLRITNFGFNIPSGSFITGITVTVNGFVSVTCSGSQPGLQSESTIRARLIDGASTSSSRERPMHIGAGDADVTLGQSTNDLWGGGWTSANISSSGFGVELEISATCTYLSSLCSGCPQTTRVTCAPCFSAGTANLDHVTITVRYSTLPPTIAPIAWGVGIPEQSGVFAISRSMTLANPDVAVTQSGWVGLGTQDPQAPLHMVTAGPLNTGFQLRLTNTAAPSNTRTASVRVADEGLLEMTSGGVTLARLQLNGTWTTSSDARLKEDVTPAEGLLDAALRLRPVRFRWLHDGAPDFGLLAQDVRGVLPELVSGTERQMLTVDYARLGVVAIGAVQAHERALEALRAENADLRARLERLESLLRATPAE